MNKIFTLITGSDEYRVDHEGRTWYNAHMVDDAEIVDSRAQTVAEVQIILNRASESVQTLPLLGGDKTVWLRGVNFVSDTIVGRSEQTKTYVRAFTESLSASNLDGVHLLITACPVDRRTREFKTWAECAHHTHLEHTPEVAAIFLVKYAHEQLHVRLSTDVAHLLLEKVDHNLRAAILELHKLTAFVNFSGHITAEHVADLTPSLGEGNFFEFIDRFYERNLDKTLVALERYFFVKNEPRPLLAALQGRNRIMIQLKSFADKYPNISAKTLEQLSTECTFFDKNAEKSNFSIVTQNPWYLGKLLQNAARFSLKSLLHFQLDLTQYFEEILRDPGCAEKQLKFLTIKMLRT